MKKSLSLIVAIAMVFTMFHSVAFAEEKSTLDKFNELVDAGIFTGTGEGDNAQLDKNMDRGSAAVIVARLACDNIQAPAEPTFSDVDKYQPWYAYVECAAEMGIIVGDGDGTFRPYDNVSKEELAVMLAKAYAKKLGLEIDTTATIEDSDAHEWAHPYIKVLQDLGIMTDVEDWTSAAIRADLVNVTYAVNAKIQEALTVPDKVSVSSAKAAGVQKVEVQLNKAVDTDKAKLTLKKGNRTIDTETAWAEDGKSAVLTLKDTKITAGEYSVTLEGVEDIANDTAEFTAEDETVARIEFVTASDEIASSKKAKVKLRAENQYGELASFSASYYTATALNLSPMIRKDSEGYLIVTMDTEPTAGNNLIQGVSRIPVYVSFDNNRVTANKTFLLGTPPFATTMELGEVKYSNDSDQLSGPGETATVVIHVFDQYGNPLTPEQDVNVNLHAFLTPHQPALNIDLADTSDDEYKVKVSITDTNDPKEKIEKAETYTLTVLAGSATKTVPINVGPARVAMTVKIGEADRFTANETGVSKYVTLEAYDVDGNPLTPHEIVQNISRINVNVSGATSTGIVKTGKHKGKIKITDIPNTPNGYVFVTASISTINTISHDTKQFRIETHRVPDRIVVKEKPAAKAVLGGSSTFELQVVDQYGDDINAPNAAHTTNKQYFTQFRIVNNALAGHTLNTTVTKNSTTYAPADNWVVGPNDDFTGFNGEFTFNTNGNDRGVARVEALLIAKDLNTGNESTLSRQTVTIESISPDSYLVYSLKDLGTLYATSDAPAAYDFYGVDDKIKPVISNVLKRTVEVSVKDGAGNSVAVGRGLIESVVSSNYNVLDVSGEDVLGIKPGTATVTASVYAVDGTVKTIRATGTVKNDAIEVKEIKAEDEITITANHAMTGGGGVISLLDLKVIDQYGNEFTGDGLFVGGAFARAVGISFSIDDIIPDDPTIDASARIAGGNIVTSNVAGFTLTISSADGEVEESVAVIVN